MQDKPKNHAMKFLGGITISEHHWVNNWGNPSSAAAFVSIETAREMADGADAFVHSETAGGLDNLPAGRLNQPGEIKEMKRTN